jgi:hypothetical protein
MMVSIMLALADDLQNSQIAGGAGISTIEVASSLAILKLF